MNKERIKELIDKQIAGLLTAQEQDELLEMLSQPGQDEVNEVLAAQFEAHHRENEFGMEDAKIGIFNTVVNIDKVPVTQPEETFQINPPAKIRSLVFKKYWWAAAAVLLVVLAGSFFWNNIPDPSNDALVSQPPIRIAPGKDGAILTLADGSQVVLDSMGNGVVASQNGVTVALKDGKLTYEPGSAPDGTVLYNTMSTPKGRQFMVVLPDGTKVWLNSASTLRYPVAFSQHERVVDISGEAYFEVARNPEQPFRVNVADKAQVEVLGTHFNINAYENEKFTRATLLEGSVRMKAANQVVLTPGQQAQLEQNAGSLNVIANIDLEQVMAWKNGVFSFEGMRLKEVMKQLERWYDVEIAFEEGVKDVEFYGELSRNNSLNDIIAVFTDVDVHFRLEGRKLTVTKN